MLWVAAQLPEHVRRCIKLGSDISLSDVDITKRIRITSSVQLCHSDRYGYAYILIRSLLRLPQGNFRGRDKIGSANNHLSRTHVDGSLSHKNVCLVIEIPCDQSSA